MPEDSLISTCVCVEPVSDTGPQGREHETFCVNSRFVVLPVDQSPRLIPQVKIARRELSELRTTRIVQVVDLTGTGASRINAGAWLSKCDPSGYLHTRRWVAAILAANPDIDGVQYHPRHDENTLAWMLADEPAAHIHPAVTAVGGVIARDRHDRRCLNRAGSTGRCALGSFSTTSRYDSVTRSSTSFASMSPPGVSVIQCCLFMW